MIIATWNVFKGKTEDRANELRKSYDADIIAFQETSFSDEAEYAWRGDPGKLKKGVSIWTQYKFETMQPNLLGSPSIGIQLGDTPLGKLNILNLWAKPKPDYYEDLMNSLEAYDDFIKSAPTIILGDFNMSVRVKGKIAKFKKLNSHLETEYGLTSAYHSWNQEAFGLEADTTLYFQWRESSIFHCDYIYVPKALTKSIKSISIPNFDSFNSSDHRPVICEFDI